MATGTGARKQNLQSIEKNGKLLNLVKTGVRKVQRRINQHPHPTQRHFFFKPNGLDFRFSHLYRARSLKANLGRGLRQRIQYYMYPPINHDGQSST